MRGWRVKVLFILIIYFAGFATAIYTLVPTPDAQGDQVSGVSKCGIGNIDNTRAEAIGLALHSGIDKYGRIAKEKALVVGELIKTKLAEAKKREEK